MAIGDSLMSAPRGGLVGPVSFTPEMRKQGIQLLPPGNTTNIEGPEGSTGDLFPGAAPGVQDFKSLQGKMRMEPDTMRAIPQGQQVPIFSPNDIRQPNPFNPSESIVPEDDALTPEGIMAPSEMKETGSFFSKLGDLFANPASAKFLASVGMAMAPQNTALGEFAIDMAESKAQQRFRKGLEEGQAAGDILVPGLSTEGRRSVTQDFEAERQRAAQREEAAGIADRAERRLEEVDIPQERRLGEVAEAQLSRMELEEQAMVRAAEFAESQDPNQMLRAAEPVIGKIPEGADFSQFSTDQTFDLIQELASIRKIQLNTQGRPSKSGVPEMSEAMRQVSLKDLGSRLSEMRKAYASAPATGGGSERALALREINDISNQILELGGDPTQFTAEGGAGASTSAGPDPGIQKIMDVTGFDEERVKAMSASEKAQWLRGWLQQQGTK